MGFKRIILFPVLVGIVVGVTSHLHKEEVEYQMGVGSDSVSRLLDGHIERNKTDMETLGVLSGDSVHVISCGFISHLGGISGEGCSMSPSLECEMEMNQSPSELVVCGGNGVCRTKYPTSGYMNIADHTALLVVLNGSEGGRKIEPYFIDYPNHERFVSEEQIAMQFDAAMEGMYGEIGRDVYNGFTDVN